MGGDPKQIGSKLWNPWGPETDSDWIKTLESVATDSTPKHDNTFIFYQICFIPASNKDRLKILDEINIWQDGSIGIGVNLYLSFKNLKIEYLRD